MLMQIQVFERLILSKIIWNAFQTLDVQCLSLFLLEIWNFIGSLNILVCVGQKKKKRSTVPDVLMYTKR